MLTLRSISSPEVQVPSGLLLLRQLKDGFHHQGADASYHAFDEHGQDETKRAPMHEYNFKKSQLRHMAMRQRSPTP